jgi:hypothetical protein
MEKMIERSNCNNSDEQSLAFDSYIIPEDVTKVQHRKNI